MWDYLELPRQSFFGGSYSSFLTYSVVPKLHAENLPAALRWCAAQPPEDIGPIPELRERFSLWRSNTSKTMVLLTYLPIPFYSGLDRFVRCRIGGVQAASLRRWRGIPFDAGAFLRRFFRYSQSRQCAFCAAFGAIANSRRLAVVYRQDHQWGVAIFGYRGNKFGLPVGMLVGTGRYEHRLARLSAESYSSPRMQSNL